MLRSSSVCLSINMDKNRIIWVDYSKAILIVLVVFAHCPFVHPLFDVLICGFHMPAFFIISGYLHKYPGTIVGGIKKNIRRLLFPALLFSALCYVYWLLRYLLHEPFSFYECITKPLLGLFFYDTAVATPVCGVIWFLVALFLCFLLLDCAMRFMKRRGVIVLSLIFMVVTIWFAASGYKDFQYGYYLQRTVISFPFVAFGFLCREYKLLKMGILHTRSIMHILAIACGLVLIYVFLILYNGRVGIHSCTFGKSALLYYAASIIGSLALFHWVSLLKNIPQFVANISSNTIVILCLHQVIIQVFAHIWVNPYFITVMAIVLCYLTIPLFNKYFPCFLGKSYHKKQRLTYFVINENRDNNGS